MKKFLLTLALMFTITPAFAANKAVVQCLNSFSSNSPSAYFSGKVVEEVEFKNGVLLRQGAILNGKVVQVVDAKRAKRDAYFIIKPTSYTDPYKKTTYHVKDADWEAKVVGYKPFDAKETAKKAGISVANFFVQGFSTAYHFGNGFIHPSNGRGRFKSGVHEAYDNSILSYIEEGDALKVRSGDYLALKFYQSDVPKWKFWAINR